MKNALRLFGAELMNLNSGDGGDFVREFLKRFKSKALWISLAALIIFCAKCFCGVDISYEVDGLLNVALPVLVAFGVINNPTDRNGI